MSASIARWPHMPSDMGEGFATRAGELYNIDNAPADSEGLIECSVLPLRDTVLYPNMVTPLFVVHDPSLLAIEDAIRAGETMIAIAQLDPAEENPTQGDLYGVGTEIAVGRLMHVPDGSTSVLTHGRRRIQVVEFIKSTPYMRVRAKPFEDLVSRKKKTVALMRAVLTLFEKCVRLNRSLPEEAYLYAVNVEDPG